VSVRDEQVHALVQQLFLRPEAGLARNVVFAPTEESVETARLCGDVAKVLAEEARYTVGLIDAGFDAIPLEQQLEIPVPLPAKITWPVVPRLRFVPCQSWWPEAGVQPVTDQNTDRLREVMAEFDFSIVCCSPICWITARIALHCDGLVLVLTANKTRHRVAAQIKDRLDKLRIPLLGTVLANRRFPVPQGLYRSL
jgi:hypothetical protein